MRILRWLFPVLFCGSLLSCENDKGAKPTDHEQQLVRTYVSLVVLNERFPATTNPDSTHIYQQHVDSILSYNGYTREEFQKEFQDLVKSPDRFQPLMNEMVNAIQRTSRP